MRTLLDEIGLGGERVRMFNLSAAMGARLAEIATEMTEKVKTLGPNPLGAPMKEQAVGGDSQSAGTG